MTAGSSSSRLASRLFSFGGVLALAVALIALNYLASFVSKRIDLTGGKVYTLSEGTRQVLAKLQTPVRIRYYASQGENVPVQLRSYARRVDDLLSEYRAAAGGRLIVEKLDPQPDSDAEDAAKLDGMQPQALGTGESFYLGLAVSQLDQKLAIPYLAPERERLLEYDLSRAIAGATTTKKPVLGVMTGMPMFGAMDPRNPMAPPSEPWYVVSELKRDYDLRTVTLGAEKIDDDIKALLVVHPRGLTEGAQYALDQFVLRGGKLIALVDGLAFFDPRGPMAGGPPVGSSLEPLLKAWGITFDATKVAADPSMMFGRGMQATPTLLTMTGESVDTTDIATNQVQNILLAFSGAFGGTPVQGLKQTVLFRTSANAGLIDNANATQQGMAALKDFKPAGSPLALAIRLTGKFPTAFPGGAPKAAAPAAGAAPAPAPAAPAATALKESVAENSVVLIGDADFLNDQVALQVAEVFGQKVVVPRNDNLSFLLSLVEQMTGDSALTGLRTRASFGRPFTRVNEMETRAAEGYRGKLEELEKTLTDTRTRLTDLQKNKTAGQKNVVTAEQQAELDNFRKRESEVKRDLKELRKSLRHDIDSLEFWTKVVNIALVPILVAVAGIALGMARRRRALAS